MNSETIMKIVNEETGCDVRQQTRKRYIAESRFIYFDLCRKYASNIKSLMQIGKTVKRDHASVLHGVRRCKDWNEVNRDFRFKYSAIEDLVKKEFRTYKRFKNPITAHDRISFLENQMKLLITSNKDLKQKNKRLEKNRK